MAAWTDLVADATNGPLIDWDARVVEGRDWRFEWPATAALADHNGDPFDFSTVSNADVNVIVTDNQEATVLADAAWTWTGNADGTFVLVCDRGATAGKAGTVGAYGKGRSFRWRVKVVVFGGFHVDFIGGEFHIDQDGGIPG